MLIRWTQKIEVKSYIYNKSMRVYKFILFLIVVVFNNSYSQIDKILFDESEFQLIRIDSTIEDVTFSNETKLNLYECEFKYLNYEYSRLYKFYLIDENEKFLELDFSVNRLNERLWYYEISDSSIFVIINHNHFRDLITIKEFNIKSGELMYSARGEIPCNKPLRPITGGWQLGNNDCEWINFNTSEVTFRASRGQNSILIYNWKNSEEKILVDYLAPMTDAATGGCPMNNIKYNTQLGRFEYK